MKFPKDNKIMYFQDFNFYLGVPDGIDFKCKIINGDTLQLTAPEYGGKPYGNGSLLVRLKQEDIIIMKEQYITSIDLLKIAFKSEKLKLENPAWHLAAEMFFNRINEKSL